VENGAVYLIACCDYFVSRPRCYVINQQRLQRAVNVLPRVASNYSRSYYSTKHLTTLAHTNQTRAQLLFYCIHV